MVHVNKVIHRREYCLESIENLYSGCSVFCHSETVNSYRAGPSRLLEAYTGKPHEQGIRLGLLMRIYPYNETLLAKCDRGNVESGVLCSVYELQGV